MEKETIKKKINTLSIEYALLKGLNTLNFEQIKRLNKLESIIKGEMSEQELLAFIN